jgi:hypothetical protein
VPPFPLEQQARKKQNDRIRLERMAFLQGFDESLTYEMEKRQGKERED